MCRTVVNVERERKLVAWWEQKKKIFSVDMSSDELIRSVLCSELPISIFLLNAVAAVLAYSIMVFEAM